MADTLIAAQPRETTGTAEARRLRREGLVPGILYGLQRDSRMLQMNRHDFELLLHRHASESLILDLKVGEDSPCKVLLKEVQHDSLTGDVLHADFVEISMTEKMSVNLPIRLVGEPVGVTQAGGIIDQLVRDGGVECRARDLGEDSPVNVEHLRIGDSILVGDLELGPTLEILTAPDVAVAHVEAPRMEEEETAAAEEGEEGAEPEVIGEEGEEKTGEEEERDKKEE